jgi:signal peptidase II
VKKSYFVILAFIALDQVTKWLAKLLYTGVDQEWLGPLLHIGYAENRGMSFGLLEGQTLFFSVITIIALAVFGYLYQDVNFKTKKLYSYSLVLFIAGTFGNAIDRLLLGYVIDFMHFPFLDGPLRLIGLTNFYNNFADMYLNIAFVMFFIDLIFLEPKRSKA